MCQPSSSTDTYCNECGGFFCAHCDTHNRMTFDRVRCMLSNRYMCRKCSKQGCSDCSQPASITWCGKLYCAYCYTNYAFRCNACSGQFNRDELATYNHITNRSYCKRCFKDYGFSQCDKCGESYESGLIKQNSKGKHVCNHCSPNYWPQHDGILSNGSTKEIQSEFTYGIELETTRAPFHFELFKQTGWGAKADGSIEGIEFVSPILRHDEGLASVRNFCYLAKAFKFRVGRTCGFHLHIGMGDLNHKQIDAIAAAYYLYTYVWKSFVSDARASNEYCTNFQFGLDDILNRGIDRIVHETDYRYEWLNWNALKRFNTYEVRLHSATLNPIKVINWTKAHLWFSEFFKDWTAGQVVKELGETRPSELFEFAKKNIWKTKKLGQYLERRAKKFGHSLSQQSDTSLRLRDTPARRSPTRMYFESVLSESRIQFPSYDIVEDGE